MASRDIIVIGASAGGVEALQSVVRSLPMRLPAAIFVVVHFPERAVSILPRILSRAGPLSAVHAADGDQIVPGRIYVAPPDRHLMLSPNGVRLFRGPKENGNRPAIDPLFRSAATAFGQRVIGVVLSGSLDDGTSGLASIKRHGGLAVVQEPEDAMFASMPRSAIDNVKVDRVAPARYIAKILKELVDEPIASDTFVVSKDDMMENELSAGNLDAIETPDQHPGTPSTFGCPDCGGVLWELRDGEFIRFRCRVGHAWSGDALLAEQTEQFDDAMWTALRALEESASLSRQIAARHRARGADSLARRFDDQAETQESRAEVIRAALVEPTAPSEEEQGDNPRRAS
jgi:two-component system chemotaxis response regulator CheB